MVIKAILALGLCGFAAAFLVTLAKLQEEKERRWDETSLALTIEKEKNKEIETLNEWNRSFEKRGDFWYDTSEKLVHERDDLQDRLSAILCPHNDHVWKDGCCVKCGRVKDA